jgi:hypothetical protein
MHATHHTGSCERGHTTDSYFPTKTTHHIEYSANPHIFGSAGIYAQGDNDECSVSYAKYRQSWLRYLFVHSTIAALCDPFRWRLRWGCEPLGAGSKLFTGSC